MKHLLDEQYKEHEVSYYQDGNWIAVDIRADNYDGDIIGAYTEQLTILGARMKAYGFVDGWEEASSLVHQHVGVEL